jgi:hypothetical protein
LINERTLPEKGPQMKGSADLERAGFDDDGGGGAAAGDDAGLDDRGAGGGFRVGLEFEHLGLQGDQFEQVLHALAGEGGNGGELGVAAEVGGLQAVFRELGFHAVHIGGRQVALVDGDDDGLAGLFGVFDGFERLRHDAVVGGDHDDDDVGDVRAAGAHVGENRVARGVEEGDFLVVVDDLIGTDVLGDATRLAGGDLGLAEESRGSRFCRGRRGP